MNRIALTKIEHQNTEYIAYCGLDNRRELTGFQLFPLDNKIVLDQIYIARVEKILTNIHAAFVKISHEQTCYLSLEDAKDPIYTQKKAKKPELCVGDEVLVQIVKEAVKTKEPVCTTKLTIYGRNCIVTSHNHSIGISKKIGTERSDQLKQLLSNDCDKRDYGVVLRTSAENLSDDVILKDVNETIEAYHKLLRESVHKSVFSIVYQNPSGYVKAIKSLNIAEVDKIYTDQSDLFEELREEFYDTDTYSLVELYDDPQISLAALYHLTGQIDKLIHSKVWLDSGANIIIEQLETLTVIDINTGKNQAKKANIIKSVNLEAAKEIVRQLRLRNISGMIIIDFINMQSKEDEQELISFLKKELQKDSVPCKFIDITKLGLVEITRKKVHRSLKEILKNENNTK